MMPTDKVFEEIICHLQNDYPHRKIKLESMDYGDIVFVDGEAKFNATGYNLLSNMKEILSMLEEELW